MNQIFAFSVYVLMFVLSLYVLKPLKFDQFMKVNEPWKCQILYILLAMGLAYVSGSFILQMRLI